MIKLERTSKPVELTVELQTQLTNEFKLTAKSVWNKDFIKNNLLKFSHNKCCYCEMNIKEESKYLEVEHFHHKNFYKDEVLEWENLLPSCKKCNATKNDHDTVKEPIIDPSKIDPKKHLKYWRYRIKGYDDIGKLTVSVLNLNDQDRLVKMRFEIGNAIQIKLELFNELLTDYINGIKTTTQRKNRIVNGVKDLMKEGLPNSVYSATTATIIVTDTEFSILKANLILVNLWDDELSKLESTLNNYALDLER
ncbi:hypothetical protein OA88_13010 [Flavobacterium sp. JRM]|nr:hypothetical protein OA88_13010 [Flavobacterium sp. JRM]